MPGYNGCAGELPSGAPVELMPRKACKRLRRLSELLLRNGDQRCIGVYGNARRGVLAKVCARRLAG